jgi:hypothetical protein
MKVGVLVVPFAIACTGALLWAWFVTVGSANVGLVLPSRL